MPEIGQKSALDPFELYTSGQDNPIAATAVIGTVGTAAAIGIVRAIRAASEIGITGVIAAPRIHRIRQSHRRHQGRPDQDLHPCAILQASYLAPRTREGNAMEFRYTDELSAYMRKKGHTSILLSVFTPHT